MKTWILLGIHFFNAKGSNLQDPVDGALFNGCATLLDLTQETTSKAIFINLGYDITEDLRLSGGLRYTDDDKEATADVGTGPVYAEEAWNEVSFDLFANYTLENGLNIYGSIQNGYQSGQFSALPYCLFDDPNCFSASENITVINYEMGLKGEVTDSFSMSVVLFNTDYEVLPYQVSTTAEGGFNTTNVVVEQTSRGVEFESTWELTEQFKVHSSFGYIDVDVDEQGGVKPVAPLTPEVTASISPSYHMTLESGNDLDIRLDYSYRGDMYGEPTSDPGRHTLVESRQLVNIDISYTNVEGDYTLSLYGRNIFDERYDNARLNTGDYVLQVLSNDPSEFGVRYLKHF